MNPIRPLARALPRAHLSRSTFAASSSVPRRLLTTPSNPVNASVSEVNIGRNIKEDPGEGDELITEDAPSGKGNLLFACFAKHLIAELTLVRNVWIQDRRGGNQDWSECQVRGATDLPRYASYDTHGPAST